MRRFSRAKGFLRLDIRARGGPPRESARRALRDGGGARPAPGAGDRPPARDRRLDHAAHHVGQYQCPDSDDRRARRRADPQVPGVGEPLQPGLPGSSLRARAGARLGAPRLPCTPRVPTREALSRGCRTPSSQVDAERPSGRLLRPCGRRGHSLSGPVSARPRTRARNASNFPRVERAPSPRRIWRAASAGPSPPRSSICPERCAWHLGCTCPC